MNFKPIQFAQTADLQQIHEKSLHLLKRTGVRFHSEAVPDILKKAGAAVDGNVVRFPPAMVNAALAQCPSSYRFSARNPQRDLTVGDGIVMATNVGCIYVEDLDHGRRRGTLQDYSDIQKLYQASPTCDIVGYTPVDTAEIAADRKHLYMMLETLRHTDKPVLCWALEREKICQLLQMVAIAFGKTADLTDVCVTGVGVNPSSPLVYEASASDTLVECGRRHQPVFLAPAPMTGISSPIQLPATAVLQNAEILAGIVLVQHIHPGNPVVYMPGGFIGSMKYMNCVMGSPEMMLMNALNLQLARTLYHLPTRSHAGTTDAKACDVQAGLETMQNMMMSLFCGVNMFHLALGVLDAGYCTSLEKMIVDEEIFERLRRLHRGIETDGAAFATDVIEAVGVGGMYLRHKSTRQHCRTPWEPTVSIWEPYAKWTAKGSQTVMERANAVFKKRLAAAPLRMIDDPLDRELCAYVKRAEKE